MKILILMAGSSESFRTAGYPYPKPLIEIAGKPLVQHILESIASLCAPENKVIVAVRKEENAKYHITQVVHLLDPSAIVLEIPGQPAGAACSAMLAIDLIDNAEPLVVINGDQVINVDFSNIMSDFKTRCLDGGIIVFRDVHPRWSFVKSGEDGLVIEAAEKRPISNLATAGFYYFKEGRDFVSSVKAMILKGAVVNGSYFICPVYNEMILKNQKIGTFLIEKKQYVSLATPHACEQYESKIQSRIPNETE
jgi:dTDP-glucose pyrophosphorylase